MTAIHQFLPTFAPRDAIGTHALHVRRILRELGLESEIFAKGFPQSGPRHALPYLSFAERPAAPDTWLLYQLSTGSPVAEFLQARPEPKLVNYHNVTTASFFAPWEPLVAAECSEGRRQLRDLAPYVELAIADSAFNETELKANGYGRTAVSPILVDFDGTEGRADQDVLARLEREKQGGGSDWLFVGRVAPHKSQLDVVRALAVHRRLYDPRARLHLVGGSASHTYLTTLQRCTAALGLAGAVTLTGSVTPAALLSYFKAADVFVCLSEHEGFCVPIVEAMRLEVPVVAFAATAVPETVAAAGILLDSKDPLTVAAAVHRVLSDDALRRLLVQAGTARVSEFSLERSTSRFREVISGVLANGGGAPGER